MIFHHPDGTGSQSGFVNGPRLGLVEWFHYESQEQVERTLAHMAQLGITELRTGISWADFHRPGGETWVRWLIQRIAEEATLLPCFHYTPPSRGMEPKVSSPPRDLEEYGNFVCWVIDELGDCFEWVELWNEPNNLTEWDWVTDSGWQLFGRMIRHASYWSRQKGKKVALGGMSPIDPDWLRTIAPYGALDFIDAVGIHGFPGTWEDDWLGWKENVNAVQAALREFGHEDTEVWITETGYSTWRHDELAQISTLLTALSAPTERVYWYGLFDLDPDFSSQSGFHKDDRDYHFGLLTHDGTPKLLCRLWEAGGISKAEQVEELTRTVHIMRQRRHPVVITGGAGFVGTNLAHRLLRDGRKVIVYDSLARAGVEENATWLRQQHGHNVDIRINDVRDRYALRSALRNCDTVYHLAGQAAVTTSVEQPVRDFEINARGTLNLLDEVRRRLAPPTLIFTSTNKVYGKLGGIELEAVGNTYLPTNEQVREHGIDEAQPLDFQSPYGCSKGSADQYVLDFARLYGLPAVVFRMSCIYGPHQFGTEDQGWVAHFLIRALQEQQITIFGDGKQVRDVLFVDDLVAAMLTATAQIDLCAAQAFNIGGGPQNTISLLQFLELIAEMDGQRPFVEFDDWRPGDQRYYVSNAGKFSRLTGWQPTTSVRAGVRQLYQWLRHEYPRAPQQTAVPEEVFSERS